MLRFNVQSQILVEKDATVKNLVIEKDQLNKNKVQSEQKLKKVESEF